MIRFFAAALPTFMITQTFKHFSKERSSLRDTYADTAN